MTQVSTHCISLRSALPGRERWDIAVLKKNDTLAQHIQHILSNHQDIFNVCANPLTGRVLVIYHPQQLNSTHVEALLHQVIAEQNDIVDMSMVEPKGIKAKLRHIADNNKLYEVVKTVETSPQLRKKALRYSVMHSSSRTFELLLMGFMLTSILSPIQALTNLGLNKTAQLGIFSSIFFANKYIQMKIGNRKNRLWAEFSDDVDQNLSHQVIEHVQTLPMSELDNHSTEKLMDLAKNDVESIKRFLGYTPSEFADKATAIVLSTGVLLAISPVGLLLGLLPIPYMIKLNKKQQEAIAVRGANSQSLDDKFNQLLSNNINGLATVKSFTAEKIEVERLDKIKTSSGENKIEIDRANSYDSNSTLLIFNLGLTVPLIYTSLNVLAGKVGMLGFMFQNSMSPNIFRAATGLEYGKALYQGAHGAATRLDKLLNTSTEKADGQQPQHLTGELQFNQVNFGYNQQPVLNDISINIGAKQKVAFVGPTGSGKSTIIKLLLRFYDLSEGAITLDGQDINDIELKSLRKSISLVSQDAFLFNGTIYENILYGRPDASYDEVVAASKVSQAFEFIDAHPDKFNAQVGERGNKLSGGQRQRVAIARAVLKKSPVLILDEATSAVDNETEAAIKEAVRLISQDATVIIIAHRLSTINYVDTIFHLKGGQITEQGNHQHLLDKNGDYAKLWQLQIAEQKKEQDLQSDVHPQTKDTPAHGVNA